MELEETSVRKRRQQGICSGLARPRRFGPFGAELLRLRRGLHLVDQRADRLGRREPARQQRTLARPLRAIAGLTFCLGRGV